MKKSTVNVSVLLVSGVLLAGLSGCGNKGDLELIQGAPDVTLLPTLLSVPEESEPQAQPSASSADINIPESGVTIDLTDVTPITEDELKKKKAISE